MKFTFKQEFLTLGSRGKIYDENQNVAYYFESEVLRIFRTTRLYDLDNKEVVRVSRSPMIVKQKYDLYIDDKYFDTFDCPLFHQYTIKSTENNITLKATGLFAVSYDVYMGNEFLGNISRQVFYLIDTFVIDVLDTKNKNLMIGISLILDLMIDSRK